MGINGGKPPLGTNELLRRGFSRACQWQISANRLSQSDPVPSHAGVYAFCLDGVARYVGLASLSLAKRLTGYANPGPTQQTNIRLNALLIDLARMGKTVEVMVATPPDFDWYGWTIRGAEGLEAGLIRDFDLPWNVPGRSPARVEPVHSVAPDAQGGKPVFATERIIQHHAGKYGPLRSHLEESGKDRISMTFEQIEALVGKLPKSASLHQAWWGNHEGNSQAKAWMGARYTVEANPRGRSVIFRRFTY